MLVRMDDMGVDGEAMVYSYVVRMEMRLVWIDVWLGIRTVQGVILLGTRWECGCNCGVY